MRDTKVSGIYSQLFDGEFENVVQCENIQYESKRKEKLTSVQLNVKDCSTIEESFRHYVVSEDLKGDNQYDAGEHGKQDARKFIRFTKFPPVLQVQLNRFDYDFEQESMTKINTRFEFQKTLNLDLVLPDENNQSQKVLTPFSNKPAKNLYHLHSILIHRGSLQAGHYFGYIRPDMSDNWYEFNDSKVAPIPESTAFNVGYGGYDYTFSVKD